ncbi:MAG: zinc metallopeptidase [bacterium]|nr:zinc metallopeptidase [bacterium]
MFYGIDPLYWMMMLPVLILSGISSWRVKSAFKKYSKVKNSAGMTGAQMAETILKRNGLSHVQVKESKGFLSDHYDPTKKVVKLSPDVYNNASIAAIGVAAHETGHAIQHKKSYGPLKLRSLMVPVASFGSNMAWVVIMIGFFMSSLAMVKVGIVLFSTVVFFQLVTLPVEFDASSRAKKMLAEYALVPSSDIKGVGKVLSAAAMTYVAAAASAIMTLIYFLIRAGLIGDD